VHHATRGDRWIDLSVVDDALSAAERAFGRTTDGRLLDRYALETAIDLLSAPARVADLGSDPAARRGRDRTGRPGTAR
jgi:hypothetical protein